MQCLAVVSLEPRLMEGWQETCLKVRCLKDVN